MELFPRLFLTSRTQKRPEKAKKGQNPPRISTLRLFRAQRDGCFAHFPFDVRVQFRCVDFRSPGGRGGIPYNSDGVRRYSSYLLGVKIAVFSTS